MNKKISIFNPYSLLILAVFVEYFPTFFNAAKPSIILGPVHLFFTDIIAIMVLVYAFFSNLSSQMRSSLKKNNVGRGIQIIFGLFFVYSCSKWIFQSDTHDTGSIRMMLSYTLAYLVLFFFPVCIRWKEGVGKLLSLLIAFLVYIFILHIYAFATQGYKIHILSGAFLSMLGILYFLALRENDLLKLSGTQSFIVKALVITTYFMVGHRSGLIALLVGLAVYSIYYKKSAIKEMTVLIAIILVGAGIAFVVSPKMLSGVEDRASSTFDASQDTYQGRFNNIFTVLDLSKENPLFGKPLVTNESVQMKAMKVTRGNTTTSVMQLVVTPHNLALEWLLYYGWLGVMLGLSLLIAMTRFVKRFLRDHKNNAKCYQAGVIMLCALSHNLFYAFSNVTTNDLFATYFLYFPLVILIAISRNEESYCN